MLQNPNILKSHGNFLGPKNSKLSIRINISPVFFNIIINIFIFLQF